MDAVIFDVEINKEDNLENGELAEYTTSICCFCQKRVDGTTLSYRKHVAIGSGQYYCPFCIRHNHHFKDGHNNLLMSFRAVFGYYYQILYNVAPRQIWLSEIVDCIKGHETAGLTNPLFKYDSETMNWFVDFNRVGKNRSFSVEEVTNTISDILDAVYLEHYLGQNFKRDLYFEKFTKAVELFYTQRQRPVDRKLLCPTFVQCLNQWHKDGEIEKTKNFDPSDVAYY